MRALAVALALSALACGEQSRLDAPVTAPVKAPRKIAIDRVEVVGEQRPDLVDVYLRRVFARLAKPCRPKRHTTARVVLTIDRVGHVTELGIRSSAPELAQCARKYLQRQRFPKVKARSLASAEVEFLE